MRFGAADVLVVFQFDAVITSRQAQIGRVGRRAGIVPLVDDELVVDPQPCTIIHLQVEAVIAAIETTGALPAYREAVRWDIRTGRTGSPIEVDPRVVPYQDGVTAQALVVVIFAFPVRVARLGALPAQLRRRPTDVFVVIHADGMSAGCEIDVRHVRDRAGIVPLIDEQLIVDPQLHAIIDDRREAVIAALEVQRACPLYREVIDREIGRRPVHTPLEVDVLIVTDQRGLSLQMRIHVVRALPCRDRRRGRCSRRRCRRNRGERRFAGQWCRHQRARRPGRSRFLRGRRHYGRRDEPEGCGCLHTRCLRPCDDLHGVPLQPLRVVRIKKRRREASLLVDYRTGIRVALVSLAGRALQPDEDDVTGSPIVSRNGQLGAGVAFVRRELDASSGDRQAGGRGQVQPAAKLKQRQTDNQCATDTHRECCQRGGKDDAYVAFVPKSTHRKTTPS